MNEREEFTEEMRGQLPLRVRTIKVQMNFSLLLNLKEQQKSGRSMFTVS